jgi:gamma-glutamylcyclotransferase (GGCT)/AIG2-like uncharacterized protein YtfP
MKRLLFVYGTLMQGQALEGYLSALDPRPARTRGRLFRLPAGYPALVPDASNDWVQGELFSLPSLARLTVLDMVEGVDNGLFSRRKISVDLQGQNHHVWAYVMTPTKVKAIGGKPIPSGDWRQVSYASPLH